MKDNINKSLSVLFFSGDVCEVRIIHKNKSIKSGYYNDFNRLANDVNKLDIDIEISGIYVTINPVKPELLSRCANRISKLERSTSEDEILKRAWLELDIDAIRPTGISASNDEHEKTIKTAFELEQKLKDDFGFPDAVIGDSGNGAHVNYKIDLPNTPESKNLIERCQKAIIQIYNNPDNGVDIQGFADANRIWKLYGTTARKGDNTPDRPHRRSKLLKIPNNIVTLTKEQLKSLSDEYIQDESEEPQDNKKPKFNIEKFIKTYNIVVKRTKKEGNRIVYILESCILNPEHTGSKEACIIQWNNGKLGYKCHHNSCKEKHWNDVRKKLEPEYTKKNSEPRTKKKTTELDDKEYHKTDLGNAHRLRVLFGDTIRFCHPYNKWVVHNGKQWIFDNIAYLESLARKVIQDIYNEGHNTEDYTKKQGLIQFALKSESNRGIEGMIKLARSEPGIPILPEVFDSGTMLFNVQNGTIDLKTGKLRPHEMKNYISKISPVIYDANATCPVWLTFLNRIFQNNQNIIEYLQRKAGYCLTGDTREEDFDELYGTGKNGKSKFTGAIIYVMGEYHQKVNVETIQAVANSRSGSAASPDVACLKGARLVTVSEPEKGTQLNEQRVKDWTGRDPITARAMYQEPFTFTPEFKLWIYTNYRLRIKGQDVGIWRRVKLIPFEVEIPLEEQDKELPEKLKQEAPGILNWMIEGCLKWQKDGLKVPSEIIEATNEYKKDQDYLGEFFRECCEIGKTYKVPFKWLYLTYRAYCELMDMPTQSHIGFSETLRDRKMKVIHTNKGNIYEGIRLKVNIEEKCNDLNKNTAGIGSEGVKVMIEFLQTYVESFSYSDLLKKPSEPSQPSLSEVLFDAKNTYELSKGMINSSNITSFSLWVCEVYKPQWQTNGESGFYQPSSIQGIASRLFKLTPPTREK